MTAFHAELSGTRLPARLSACLLACLPACLLACWLAGCLLAGWLAGWPAGWLAGCLLACLLTASLSLSSTPSPNCSSGHIRGSRAPPCSAPPSSNRIDHRVFVPFFLCSVTFCSFSSSRPARECLHFLPSHESRKS